IATARERSIHLLHFSQAESRRKQDTATVMRGREDLYTDRKRHAVELATWLARIWRTWVAKALLVATASPPWTGASPCQSNDSPPASVRIGRSAAASHRFVTGSIMISARPVATSS